MPKSTSKPIPNPTPNPALTRTPKTTPKITSEAYVEKSAPRSLHQEAHITKPRSLREEQPTVHVEKPSRMFKAPFRAAQDRKSTRLNSSHTVISYAVFCLKKKRRTHKN